MALIAAIAVPGLLRARMAGIEGSSIGSLRAINSAQSSYAASCGSGFYAPSLVSLATPPDGGEQPRDACQTRASRFCVSFVVYRSGDRASAILETSPGVTNTRFKCYDLTPGDVS